MMKTDSRQARQKVVDAIEKVVNAAQELSQAELEFLGAGGQRKSKAVRLVCAVTPDAEEVPCDES